MNQEIAILLKMPQYEPISEKFLYWDAFMEKEVEFQLKTSLVHTKAHCEKVLFFAVLIGNAEGLSTKDLDAVCLASCFHDSRRKEDGYDIGHGRRAAEYYQAFCKDKGLAFDERTYYAMSYHEMDDELGVKAICKAQLDKKKGILIYQILKDADALDRFRIGENGLDESYLRTEEARRLVRLAKKLNHIMS